MDEFSLIERYFRPLSEGFEGSLGLRDDAALIALPPGHQLVVTTDAITAGVHFIGNEDANLIAKKLLRVNLSDLAAKGAVPRCYFLTLMLPENTEEAWVARFAHGLAEDQKTFGIHLAGGDTTATTGPLALSLTALGTVKGTMLRRSGATAGNAVYVSGTLGEAAAGLACLQGKQPRNAALERRYLLPEPRLALGKALLERGIATACMDISDGLVQDLGHICEASGVAATIEASLVPRNDASLEAALSGGDDYELLFTVPAAKAPEVPQGCTPIGRITQGSGVVVLDAQAKPMTLKRAGYKHFA